MRNMRKHWAFSYEAHRPDEVLAMKVQRVLLVVSKHFKHNGLTLDVLNERLRDLNRNLLRRHNSTKKLLKLL